MGLIVGSKLKTNDFFEEIEMDKKAFGAGIGLAILMAIFLGFSICLVACKKTWLAVVVGYFGFF